MVTVLKAWQAISGRKALCLATLLGPVLLLVGSAPSAAGETSGRVLEGHVIVLEPFGPGEADPSQPLSSEDPSQKPLSLVYGAALVLTGYKLHGATTTIAQTPISPDGSYDLNNLPDPSSFLGFQLSVTSPSTIETCCAYGILELPGGSQSPIPSASPSVGHQDISVSPANMNQSWVIDGAVTESGHSKVADHFIVTAVVDTLTDGFYSSKVSSNATGRYRIIVDTTDHVRGLSQTASPIKISLSDNGHLVKTVTVPVPTKGLPCHCSIYSAPDLSVGTTSKGATTTTPATTPGVTLKFGGSGWAATPRNLGGHVGQQYRYTCPANGTVNEVWGTSVYTSDSSVCTAAVHAGFITLTGGGTVVIEIRPGLSAYKGSNHDGITSQAYGRWAASFVFVGAPTIPSTNIGYGGKGWDAAASQFRGDNGQEYQYICPKNGTADYVYGTNTYTDDSSVCTAAVLEGLVTLAQGGTVVIEIQPGASSYTGSTANGITSKSYDANPGSYTFVKP